MNVISNVYICTELESVVYVVAWKHVKLMDVTVSPDPDDPHVVGSVNLVKGG